MKKTSLFVILAIIVIVVVLFFLNTKSAPQKSPNVSDVAPKTTDTKMVSTQEVATHSTAADCWETINGKVYDLTTYAPKHPGGSKKVTDLCGLDATQAFNTIDKHQRSGITEELTTYYIGEVR